MFLWRRDKGQAKDKGGSPPGQALQQHQPGGNARDGQASKQPQPQHKQADYAASPTEPAPAYDWDGPPREPPPPTHDWQTAVPDTALLPAPPSFFGAHDRSHAANATAAEAEAGEDWCRRYPLAAPLVLDEPGWAGLRSRNIRLIEPAAFQGRLSYLAKGHWEIKTEKKSADRCIIGYPPLYVANSQDGPRAQKGVATTIYYEVKLRPDSRHNTVALGFTALPYPSFRMPGWHRGSLAVHGDDGHRFINDRWGGKDFTTEFRIGDTYGIGMTLTPTTTQLKRVDVFLTRNGVRTGGWDLHEETDAEGDLPVTGLEGFHDLSCAIGTCDGVSLEVILDPEKWKYREAADGKA